MFYGFSVFYCMTTSLAHGGEGLGTCGMPEAKVRELCTEAGSRIGGTRADRGEPVQRASTRRGRDPTGSPIARGGRRGHCSFDPGAKTLVVSNTITDDLAVISTDSGEIVVRSGNSPQ